jgi:hypothetical protein
LFNHYHKDKIIMKQEDIKIGGTYMVGLAGNLVPVLITDNHPSGTGWQGKTVKTGKSIVIRSAQRIHRELSSDNDKDERVAQQGKRKPKATTDTTDAKERDTGKPAATGGNQDTSKPMSLINAAAHILAQGKQEPMRCKDIVEQAINQNLWQPGKGLTPSATLYAAIGREIKTKGDDSRFAKAERGMFTVAQKGA